MAGVLAALLCGCRTDYTRSDQEHLRTLYYSNRLADAAAFSMKMSDAEDGETSRNALLWHLEAGSVNLDAGNFDDALTALERAEKLLWLFDRQGHIRCHEPGALTYRGYRSDRMILGMLKFFAYFSKGSWRMPWWRCGGSVPVSTSICCANPIPVCVNTTAKTTAKKCRPTGSGS